MSYTEAVQVIARESDGYFSPGLPQLIAQPERYRMGIAAS